MKNSVSVTLQITNQCNYHCPHCAFRSGKKMIEECSLQEWQTFLKHARDYGAEKLEITGGEPTLREDLSDIIYHSSSLGYKTKLITNGSLLSGGLEEYRSKGLEAVAISLDGSTPEVYEKTRKLPVSEFKKVIKSIRQSKDAGLFTKLNTVVQTINLSDLPAVLSLGKDLGVDEHRICYLTPVGISSGKQQVQPEQWLNFIRKKLVSYSQDPVYVGIPQIEKSFHLETRCMLDNAYPLHISPQGNIYACSIKAMNGKSSGNIKELNQSSMLNRIPEQPCCTDRYAHIESGFDSVCPLRKYAIHELL